MVKIKNISLIGLGAIGCAYGSQLLKHQGQFNLRIIADQQRANRYQENGIFVNGEKYDFTYVDPSEAVEPADLIIVSVKANQLTQAIKDLRNHVGEKTIILSLLNGITSEEEIGQVYGMDKMLYSLSIAIDANRVENHVHFTSLGMIVFGEKENKTYSNKVQAVKEVFEQTGISYEIPEDMLRSLWYKFMINVGINQCSAVLRGRYGVFQTINEAQKLMEATMREVIHVANQAGVGLTTDDIANWYDVLHKLNPNSRTSMLEDVESGRATEVDIFAGVVCKLGKKYHVDTPVNQILYSIIKANEAIQNSPFGKSST